MMASQAKTTKTHGKKRRCLMCRKTFLSEWPGERICPQCKRKHSWREGDSWLPGGRSA
jgi:hypothetical protein